MTYGEIAEYKRLRDLWACVMGQAIDDLVGYTKAMARHSSKRVIAENAMLWIFRTDWEGPASFVWCCYQLDIDPARVRAQVLQKLRDKQRLQTLERIRVLYGV